MDVSKENLYLPALIQMPPEIANIASWFMYWMSLLLLILHMHYDNSLKTILEKNIFDLSKRICKHLMLCRYLYPVDLADITRISDLLSIFWFLHSIFFFLFYFSNATTHLFKMKLQTCQHPLLSSFTRTKPFCALPVLK